MAGRKKSQLAKKDHETPAQVGTSSSPVLETTLSQVFVLILSLIDCLDLFKEYYVFQSKISYEKLILILSHILAHSTTPGT